MEAKYHRVLIKMSGEALAGPLNKGIDFSFVEKLCKAVKSVVDLGVQAAIVCGGGNYWRGAQDGGDRMVRTRADYMGMLAITMNCLALLDGLEKQGVEARIQSALGTDKLAEPINRDRAVRHLEKGRVVLFAGGTGEPYFTTDTGAVLRALEVDADVLLLGKNIDAIYSADPKKDPSAKRFSAITYREILEKDLKAMDAAATQLAMDNKLKLHVFGLKDPENILRAISGEPIGTVVR